jgi:hypothetical protein
MVSSHGEQTLADLFIYSLSEFWHRAGNRKKSKKVKFFAEGKYLWVP